MCHVLTGVLIKIFTQTLGVTQLTKKMCANAIQEFP